MKHTFLKWGVAGYGKASEYFINSFNQNQHSKIISLSSKTKFNYLKLNFNKCDIFDSYEQQIESKKVDIIYISLVNSLHKKIIDICIRNNKHILVEKPSCLNFLDLKSSINSLKNKKIFFKESILYLNHPITKKIQEIIENNDIGKIIKINCSFGFNFAKKKFFFFKREKKYNQNIFNKKLGGGAIYNYAHYAISAIRTFSQDKNILNVIQMKPNSYVGHTGVDEYSFLNVKFSNNIESNIELAINRNLKSFIEIIGEKGCIYADNPWSPDNQYSINLSINKKGHKNFNFKENRNLWHYEIESIEKDLLLNKKESSTPGAKISDSLFYLQFIDSWKRSINENI